MKKAEVLSGGSGDLKNGKRVTSSVEDHRDYCGEEEPADLQLTELKKRLKESEDRFRQTFEQAAVGIAHFGRDGKFLRVNSQICEILKISPEKMLQLRFQEIAYLQDFELERAFHVNDPTVKSSGRSLEKRYIREDDSEIWISMKVSPVHDDRGELIYYLLFVEDISEQVNVREALERERDRVESYLDIAGVILVVMDANGRVTMINRKGAETLGYPADDIIGKEWFSNYLPAERRDEVRRIFHQLMSGNIEPAEFFENLIVRADGEVRTIAWHNAVIRDDHGSIIGTISSGEDITESRRTREELKASEARYRSYVDNAPDGIFISDAEGNYIDVNKASAGLTGYSREELLSMNIMDLVPEEGRKFAERHFKECVKYGKSSGSAPFTMKDGNERYWTVEAVKLSDDKFLGFVKDITEMKRLRDLKSRAERLETAGTIAGQVAHDFNNLLGPLTAYPDFIREMLPAGHEAHSYLNDIENAAIKIADINQDLLAMGRRGHYDQEILDLNQIVRHVVNDLNFNADTIKTELILEENLFRIKGGKAQLHRILANLLANAKDALRDFGTITVKTENYYADDTSLAFGRVPIGEYVKLTVTDDGCGIPDDIRDKILDPFFTTKKADKKRGSGLGLSVVDAVMKDHRGYLDLSSKIGCGSSFYLYFPVTRDAEKESETLEEMKGCETLLVVDDDAVQREVSSRLLERQGYKVITAESGEEALKIVEKEKPDIVILDMVMSPGIDGTETYRRLIRINPGQKAILVSGFSETNRVKEAQKSGAGAFVKKPLTKQAIAAAVRRELDR